MTDEAAPISYRAHLSQTMVNFLVDHVSDGEVHCSSLCHLEWRAPTRVPQLSLILMKYLPWHQRTRGFAALRTTLLRLCLGRSLQDFDRGRRRRVPATADEAAAIYIKYLEATSPAYSRHDASGIVPMRFALRPIPSLLHWAFQSTLIRRASTRGLSCAGRVILQHKRQNPYRPLIPLPTTLHVYW